MSSGESANRWIERAKAGDELAIAALLQRYFAPLVGLARKHLKKSPRGDADEDDIVQSVFKSFCFAAREGRIPDIYENVDGLWRLLVAMTIKKAITRLRYVGRQKRGGGMARHGLDALRSDAESGRAPLIELVADTPDPEWSAIMKEEMERLLGMLEEEFRQVALLKLAGHTNVEVAKLMDCSVRKVERCLRLIRMIWKPEL